MRLSPVELSGGKRRNSPQMRYFELAKRKAVALASVGCLALAICEIMILANPTLGDLASLVLVVALASLFVGGLFLCFLSLFLRPISRAGILALVGVLVAGGTIVHLYVLFHSYPYSLGIPY